MATIAKNLLLILSVLYITGMATASTTIDPSGAIETSSKTQRSPRHKALAALSLSLSRTKSAESFVSNLTKHKGLKQREKQPTEDCLQFLGDSIDLIRDSVQELRSLRGGASGRDFLWHISNVQTWVSAALTDDDTCLDGFADKALDGQVKDSIRVRVTNAVQVTSNALALVNQLAKTH